MADLISTYQKILVDNHEESKECTKISMYTKDVSAMLFGVVSAVIERWTVFFKAQAAEIGAQGGHGPS